MKNILVKVSVLLIIMAVIFSGCAAGGLKDPGSTEISVNNSGEHGNPGDTGENNIPGNTDNNNISNEPGNSGIHNGTESNSVNNTAVGSPNANNTGNSISGSTGNYTGNVMNTTGGSVTAKTAIPTVPPKKNPDDQTLKYWVSFPNKGDEVVLYAYKFTVKKVDNGVSVTAYNKDNSKKSNASVTLISSWTSSYQILDSNNKVIDSVVSTGKYSTFNMNFKISGTGILGEKNVKFMGYHKDFDGSNAVVVSQNLSKSFDITNVASAWNFSTAYSTYPKSVITISNSTNKTGISINLKTNDVVYKDDFSDSHFVFTPPTGVLNDGLPTLILNVENNTDYYNIRLNPDSTKLLKNFQYNGTFAMVEGNTKTYGTAGQKGSVEMKRRGNSSYNKDKKSYTLKLDKKQPLLGMEADKEWCVIANHADKSLLRNWYAYTLQKQMNASYKDAFGVESKNIDIYMCFNGSYDYLGTYLLVEKIEARESRVNITEMTEKDTQIGAITASDSTAKKLAGSFLIESAGWTDRIYFPETVIKIDWNGAIFARSPSRSVFQPHEFNKNPYPAPKVNNVTANDNLAEYIRTFANLVNSYVVNKNYTELEKLIDIDSFVDDYILHELSKNVDGGLRYSYLYKDKGGKMRVTSWDFDIAFGNCWYGSDTLSQPMDKTSGFIAKKNGQGSNWYYHLMQMSQFSSKVKARWNSLRNGILKDSNIESTIRNENSKISKSAGYNFERWQMFFPSAKNPDLSDIEYNWPTPTAVRKISTHSGQVDWFVSWVKARAAWLDSNL